MQLESRRTTRPTIGLTPLIDVVFILLLFFMLASDLDTINHVDVGTSKSGPAAQDQISAVLLRVHGDGSYSLVDERIDESDLELRIRTYLDRNPGQTVVVQPDADVRLQLLVDILDHLTEMGVRSLTLG